jgi:hypothetical protein
MPDISRVNSQILDSVTAVTQATMPPVDARLAGLGKAVQSVAQSAAIAVQDATDNLRNSMTIATTAIGAAMAQLIAGGDSVNYDQVIKTAQGIITHAAWQFKEIGADAADVLAGFKLNPSPNPNGRIHTEHHHHHGHSGAPPS